MCKTETPETVTITLDRYERLKNDSKALNDFIFSKYTLITEEYSYNSLRILKGSNELDSVERHLNKLSEDNIKLKQELSRFKSSFWYRLFNTHSRPRY